MFDDVDYTKVMFGCEAVHVSSHMVVQNQGALTLGNVKGCHVLFVGASFIPLDNHPLMFGSNNLHVRAHGEIIFRPSGSVVESNEHMGSGINGIIKSEFFAGINGVNDRLIINKGMRI